MPRCPEFGTEISCNEGPRVSMVTELSPAGWCTLWLCQNSELENHHLWCKKSTISNWNFQWPFSSSQTLSPSLPPVDDLTGNLWNHGAQPGSLGPQGPRLVLPPRTWHGSLIFLWTNKTVPHWTLQWTHIFLHINYHRNTFDMVVAHYIGHMNRHISRCLYPLTPYTRSNLTNAFF